MRRRCGKSQVTCLAAASYLCGIDQSIIYDVKFMKMYDVVRERWICFYSVTSYVRTYSINDPEFERPTNELFCTNDELIATNKKSVL